MSYKILALCAVAAVILSGMLVRSCEGKRLADAIAQVNVAHDSLVVVQAEVRKVNAHADSLRVQGVILRAASDSALRVADMSKRTAEKLAAKLRADTACSRADVDSLVAADSIVIQTLTGAVATERKRGDSLQTGLTEALTSLARLNAAAGHLDTASHALVKASKPSFWSKITPKPGINVTAGVNTRGQFDAVAGVGLGWSF